MNNILKELQEGIYKLKNDKFLLMEKVEALDKELNKLLRVKAMLEDKPIRKEISNNENEPNLVTGSTVDKVRNLLLDAGKSLHVNTIMGKLVDSGIKKSTVTSCISQYCSKGKVFKRDGIGTYGLI